MTYSVCVSPAGDTAPAEGGDTILDALLMAGIGFSYSCQAGNCGTCKCELVSGEIEELEYSEHALSAAERARNVVLACRSQVWGDVVVRKLAEEDFIVHPSRELRCAVHSVDRLTHDIWRLRLEVRSGGPFTFTAGQYAAVTFPYAPGHARDFSMANRPDEPVLEFHVRELPGGTVSAGLGNRIASGDEVRVSGPRGVAYWRAQHEGSALLIAGGSGLAPIRSILSSMQAAGRTQPVYVYFGARRERDVYGEAELRALAAAIPSSTVNVVLSEESPGPQPHGGRRYGPVAEVVGADFSDLQGFVAYVAGPPPMVDAATALLLARGVAQRDIHADAFYPAAPSAARPAAAEARQA